MSGLVHKRPLSCSLLFVPRGHFSSSSVPLHCVGYMSLEKYVSLAKYVVVLLHVCCGRDLLAVSHTHFLPGKPARLSFRYS